MAMWHHLLKFLLLGITFGAITITPYGPLTISSELLLACTIPSFSGPALWSRNSLSLSECTASGFCQIVSVDRFSFSSNSSGIYAKINPLEQSENGVKWTCYHNNENATIIVILNSDSTKSPQVFDTENSLSTGQIIGIVVGVVLLVIVIVVVYIWKCRN